MRDLWIHEDDLVVGTHGRSFWVLDNISPLRQVSDAAREPDAFLFKPAEAYRVRRNTNTDTPLPPDEPTSQNPPDGAMVDYVLAKDAPGPMVLEVLDASGKLVRRYASTDKPGVTDEELAKQPIPLYWIRKHKSLPTNAGMHRWVWDLRYPSPDSSRSGYPISAIPGDTPREPEGPRALPGTYTVKLTVRGQTVSQPLKVSMDPRVKVTAESLTEMFRMQSQLAALMTDASRALGGDRSAREQLQKLTTPHEGTLAVAISNLNVKLTTLIGGGAPGGGPASPTLAGVNGNISALYGELDRADAAPTSAQRTALNEVEQGSAEVMKQWAVLQKTDLPALNLQLRAAHLSEIRVEPGSQNADDSEDIE